MTDAERAAAKMPPLLGLASGLGLDEKTMREIYETVSQDAEATGVSDDRMAEVRMAMLAARLRSAST